MAAIITPHHLRAADKISLQTALAGIGIQWDGTCTHLLVDLNSHQIEIRFLGTWPKTINEEGEVLSYYFGFHANAISRGATPFEFGSIEISVENPKAQWAGVQKPAHIA